MNRFSALRLRVSDEDELSGVDQAELGEVVYDYVAIHNDVRNMEDLQQLKVDVILLQKALANSNNHGNNSYGNGDDDSTMVAPTEIAVNDDANSLNRTALTSNHTALTEPMGFEAILARLPVNAAVNSPAPDQDTSGAHGSSTPTATYQSSFKETNNISSFHTSARISNNSDIELARISSTNRSNYDHGESLVQNVRPDYPSTSSLLAIPRPALRGDRSHWA